MPMPTTFYLPTEIRLSLNGLAFMNSLLQFSAKKRLSMAELFVAPYLTTAEEEPMNIEIIYDAQNPCEIVCRHRDSNWIELNTNDQNFYETFYR